MRPDPSWSTYREAQSRRRGGGCDKARRSGSVNEEDHGYILRGKVIFTMYLGHSRQALVDIGEGDQNIHIREP
jgi:hypothetical protein